MKKNLFSILFVLVCLSTSAQLTIGKNPMVQLFESSIKQGLYIARTEYQIKEVSTGNLYGLGGNEYFSYKNTLAYKVGDTYIVDSCCLAPWEGDKTFAKYEKNGKYAPVLADSVRIMNLADSAVCMTVPSESISEPLQHGECVIKADEAQGKTEGFALGTQSGEQTGWIVWVTYADDSKKKFGDSIELSIYNKTISIGSLQEVNVPFMIGNKVMGGLFVIPQIKGAGKIELLLSGVLKQNGDKWVLHPASEAWGSSTVKGESKGTTDVSPQEDDQLTPIAKPEKKQKKKQKK